VNGRQVLVIEAEPLLCSHLARKLECLAYAPVIVASVDAALAALTRSRFEFTLMAMELGGADGLDFLRRLKFHGGDPGPIIALFDPASAKRIEEAAALGADDFLQKEFKPDELENAIKEVSRSPGRLWGLPAVDDLATRIDQETSLWRSSAMQALRRVIEQAAQVQVTVLVLGETGTGKDLVARTIHYWSSRQHRRFVKVNCAAVPRGLLESELFGHERGAFTGAHQLKIGKFESAHRGTIFLDEIGDLDPSLQAKLLHVLQDGEFSRVGGGSVIRVDVRIIAATNQDLEKAVAAGRFREDLYYRLNVIQIVVPPLRERPEEIPPLVQYFAQRYGKLFGREGFAIQPEQMRQLVEHTYPGNIRELENIVKRMIVLNGPLVTNSSAPPSPSRPSSGGDGLAGRVEPERLSLKEISRRAALAAERETISRALEQTHWNRVRAAKLLRISYRALLYKIKDVGLAPGGSSPPVPFSQRRKPA
jgi:two-component system, NtrC family, response regulator AtoC